MLVANTVSMLIDETNGYGRWIHTMSCQNKVQTYQFKD